eukprot:4035224-Pleurochrysis_carterae.AAC.1
MEPPGRSRTPYTRLGDAPNDERFSRVVRGMHICTANQTEAPHRTKCTFQKACKIWNTDGLLKFLWDTCTQIDEYITRVAPLHSLPSLGQRRKWRLDMRGRSTCLA